MTLVLLFDLVGQLLFARQSIVIALGRQGQTSVFCKVFRRQHCLKHVVEEVNLQSRHALLANSWARGPVVRDLPFFKQPGIHKPAVFSDLENSALDLFVFPWGLGSAQRPVQTSVSENLLPTLPSTSRKKKHSNARLVLCRVRHEDLNGSQVGRVCLPRFDAKASQQLLRRVHVTQHLLGLGGRPTISTKGATL